MIERKVSAVCKKLQAQKNSLEKSRAIAEAESDQIVDSDLDIAEAINAAEHLSELAASEGGLNAAK